MNTTRTPSFVAGAVATGIALLLAGCGGSSGDDTTTTASEGDSGTASTVDEPSTTEPPATTAAAPEADLEGRWIGDAGELFAANISNLGDPEGMTCTGEIWMTFAGDGRFERGGEASCGVGSAVAVANISSTGSYRVTGDRLEVIDVVSTGTMNVGGVEMPFPDAWDTGDATVNVSGDTLTVTFDDDTVGTVTQTYTRAT
jgi:hypothetical protein